MDGEGNTKVYKEGSMGDRIRDRDESMDVEPHSWEARKDNEPEKTRGNSREENGIESDTGNKHVSKEEETIKMPKKLRPEEQKRLVAVEDDDIEETDKDLKNAVACKLLTNRIISEEFFTSMMPRI